jgi:hypothetical protein
MTWQDFLAPAMVIGLMAIMFLAIVTSEGTAQSARRGRKRFPPTPRDIEATGRLWRRRWRKLTPWTEHPSPHRENRPSALSQ